jgi:hypothetical protein
LFFLDDSGADDSNRVLIFASQTNLEWLQRHPEWYIDGTFSISPELFKQLFTFQIVVNGYNLPLVYALLPNKTTETYSKTLNMLYAHLSPDKVKKIVWRCDFELTIWNSLTSSDFGNSDSVIEACSY